MAREKNASTAGAVFKRFGAAPDGNRTVEETSRRLADTLTLNSEAAEGSRRADRRRASPACREPGGTPGFDASSGPSKSYRAVAAGCACRSVVTGETDPDLPHFTAGGSFHANRAITFSAAAVGTDLTPGCTVCSSLGYETMAMIPIRAKDRILGLIQLADARPNMLSAARLQMFEQVGLLLGNAIEHVKVLEALRESELTARALLDAPTDAVLLMEPDGTIVALNEPQARLFGRSKDELIGQHAFRLLPPDLIGGRWPDLEAVLRSGKRLHHGEIFIGERTFDSQLAPVTARDGTLTRVAVYARDVTAIKQAEAELRVAHDRLSTLLALSGELASTLELKPLLDLILEKLAVVVPCDHAAVLIAMGDTLQVEASRGYAAGIQWSESSVLAGRIPAVRAMRRTRSPFYLPDLRRDAAPGRIATQPCGLPSSLIGPEARSWLGAPLLVKNRLIGVLCLGHPDANRYDGGVLHLVQTFANEAAIAIANPRTYKQAQDSATAEERTRLADALHDSVTQTLFSANLVAGALSDALARDPAAARATLEKLRRLIAGASAQMRSLLLEFYPQELVEEEAEVLFGHLSQTVAAQIGLPVDLRIEGESSPSADQKIALYRIAQEALNNVAKHSDATHVSVELTRLPEETLLNISDNGCGFKPGSVPAGHLGIRLMRERAEKTGAAFSIESGPGQGTTISVRLKLPKDGESHA